MTNIIEYREGNLVEFWGAFGRQSVIIKKIISLEGGRRKFELRLSNDVDSSLTGYSEQISPIFFREQHLNLLGFNFDKEYKTHSHDGVTIAAFYYIEGEDMNNLTLGFTHYHVLPVGFVLPATKEQLKSTAVEIPFVHVLQNFFADKKIDIDFKPLY